MSRLNFEISEKYFLTDREITFETDFKIFAYLINLKKSNLTVFAHQSLKEINPDSIFFIFND